MRNQSPALIHAVTDYGADDEAFTALAEQLRLSIPEARLALTQVAPHDSLAAGLCVAGLVLGAGPSGRVVMHDIAIPALKRGTARECVGWASHGVTVVGANVGWCWSFVMSEICGPCYLDLSAADQGSTRARLLAAAIVHAVARHSHAVCGPVPAEAVLAVPEHRLSRLRRLPLALPRQ